MPDHDEAQDYKANGPSDVGFRTGGDGTGITNGVVAAGKNIGVHGIGLELEGTNALTTGVLGEGSYGVKGLSRNIVGVLGRSDTGIGVDGAGEAAGVRGIGTIIGVAGESVVIGVNGTSKGGTGVHGDSETGQGVAGLSDTGPGVHGTSDQAYGGVFTSNFAQLRLEPAALEFGPPRTGSHQKGEFFVDARGALFYCYGGSPPAWQQLAGPSLISTVFNRLRAIFSRN